jgi:hypothetical protein
MAALLAFVGGLLPVALCAQSYGLGEQVLTVGAAAFRGSSRQPVFHSDGYLYNPEPNDGNPAFYHAPFRLPDGAVITRLCESVRNEEPSPSTISVSVFAVRVAPGGPGGQVSPAYVAAAFNSGYAEFCTDGPGGYVFHDDFDFGGDGSIDHASHRLSLGLPPGATAGFGGVRIFWRRQVSPAPALATFGDVPSNAPFFQFVEALAASAITGGCGGGNYCPNAPLTRGQMAVFLSKALGLHWVN